MMGIEIPNADVDEWLGVLKPYQRSTLTVFLKTSTLEEAAGLWLSSTGSPNIVPFGGVGDTTLFWDRFKDEFRKFLCDNNSYVEEKEGLQRQSTVNKAVLVSTISASLGATIGYSATLLAPAVTLMLCAVGKMCLNAYCAGID